MRKIIVEVPDTCDSCDMCSRMIHDGTYYMCDMFDERITDFKPCTRCLEAGKKKHVLIHMDGGIPQHVAIVSSTEEAEAVIKNYNHGSLPEDAAVAEQMGNTWGRVDIDGEVEVYIAPLDQI